MFGINSDLKSSRKSKRRNFAQYCQNNQSQFNQETDCFGQDNECFIEDNSFLIRDKHKPFENDFECESMQYQPIILDPQLLKEFSIIYRLQNKEIQQNQLQDHFQMERKLQNNAFRPSSQIEAHIQYLVNQKRYFTLLNYFYSFQHFEQLLH